MQNAKAAGGQQTNLNCLAPTFIYSIHHSTPGQFGMGHKVKKKQNTGKNNNRTKQR